MKGVRKSWLEVGLHRCYWRRARVRGGIAGVAASW